MTDIAQHGRKRPYDAELIPRMMTRAMLALVLSVLALVSYARLTDVPVISTPPQSAVVLERHVYLSGELSGAATVLDANGAMIARLAPEQGGFIAGVARVLDRERAKHGVALTGPVTIIAREDGRISIHDPSTGWGADLMGFGQDNARAFIRLLAQ